MLKHKEDSVMLLKNIFNRKANAVSHFGAIGFRLFSDGDGERARIATVR
jgi:hypothetical protein